MKLNSPNKRAFHQGAFTLIEMIGVLAVIAILAAMLIPKVFNAINSARINNTAVSCETIKTATADHYGKYGKLDAQFGTNSILSFTAGPSSASATNYDTQMLIPEGLLDKPFFVKIGGGDPSTNCMVLLTTGGKENNKTGYSLDGVSNTSTNGAQYVLEAVIFGVAQQDAKDLNDLIDGPSLGAPIGSSDAKGRVEYTIPSGSSTATVFIYLTSR